MTTDDEFRTAFVLHARPYQESSALVDAFCRETGRVSLVFRRVRGGKSSRSGLLQPFQPVWLSYGGYHELRNGKQIESRGPRVWLTGPRLFSGLYLNEILVRVLPREDACPALFDLYAQTLAALVDADIEHVLRRFEHSLLAALGYDFPLDVDEHGDALRPERYYRFVAERGFVAEMPYEDTRELLLSGEILQALEAGHFERIEVRRAAKQLYREALKPLLGERPLISRQLFAVGKKSHGEEGSH